MSKYSKNRHTTFNLGYHLIFSSKYRCKYLTKYYDDLIFAFNHVSNKNKIVIKEIEIMDDHVHIFFKCENVDINIPNIVKMLKGYSSYYVRNKYPCIKKYKSFWTSSYFIESVGNISENTVRKYIKNQTKNTYTYCKFHLQ